MGILWLEVSSAALFSRDLWPGFAAVDLHFQRWRWVWADLCLLLAPEVFAAAPGHCHHRRANGGAGAAVSVGAGR